MMTAAASEIVLRAQQGDTEAFQQMVLGWRKRVLAVISRLTKRPEDAEDIAQDVFVNVYLSLHKLREPWQFEPWLNRIAKNAALDHLRRHRRFRVRLSDLPDEQIFAIERDVAMSVADDQRQSREMRDYAKILLSYARPEERRLLVLKEVEGLSVKELSERYKLGEQTVKVRLFRARKRIVERAAQDGDRPANCCAPSQARSGRSAVAVSGQDRLAPAV